MCSIAFNVFHGVDLDFACRSLFCLCYFFCCWGENFILVLKNVNSFASALCEIMSIQTQLSQQCAVAAERQTGGAVLNLSFVF